MKPSDCEFFRQADVDLDDVDIEKGVSICNIVVIASVSKLFFISGRVCNKSFLQDPDTEGAGTGGQSPFMKDFFQKVLIYLIQCPNQVVAI